jgi:hypothetical protein
VEREATSQQHAPANPKEDLLTLQTLDPQGPHRFSLQGHSIPYDRTLTSINGLTFSQLKLPMVTNCQMILIVTIRLMERRIKRQKTRKEFGDCPSTKL